MTLKPIITAVGILSISSSHFLMAEETIKIPTGITLSGLLQVEAQVQNDYMGTETSDFVVDELGVIIEAQVHQSAKATIAFLYEEKGTPLQIDEAFLTFGKTPLNLTIGQLYVPFGNLETHMISDPLTLGLAEAQEKAAQLNFESGILKGAVYVFNGTTQEKVDDKIDHYGANVGIAQKSENSLSYDLGISYINDIGDTDGVSAALGGTATSGITNYDYVDAMGGHINLAVSGISLYVEYLTALDDLNDGDNLKIQAWNTELGYTFKASGQEMTFAVGYQGTKESVILGLPETRYLLGFSMGIYENTTLAVEYARSEDYELKEGGTGENADNFTVQLAIKF